MSTRFLLMFLLAFFIAPATGAQGHRQAVFYNFPLFATDVVVSGDAAYLAGGEAGLIVLDVSDSTSPKKIGSYRTTGNALGLAVSGSLVYVAYGEGGLRIVDISNPARPIEAGFYNTPSSATGVAVDGDYAYVSDYDRGLRIIDLANPSAPAEIGFFDTPGNASDVAIVGKTAFIADWEGLSIIDVTDPANPVQSAYFRTPSSAWDVAVAGKYAYIAGGDEGLRIVDISDLASPGETGFYDTQGVAIGVSILGDVAYLGDREAGMRIIDISDPANPRESGFFDTPGSAIAVAIAGNIAYVADGERGMRVIDLSIPARLGEIGFYQTRGSLEDTVQTENTVLAISTVAGILAALLVHLLSWYTRVRWLTVAVRLGFVSALGSTLYSGGRVIAYFLGPSGGADAFYIMRYVYILFWALALLTVLVIGLFQARSLPVPGWQGVLSFFYEIGLGFLAVVAVHFALKYLIRTPDTGLSDRVYVDRFIFSFGVSLGLLGVIRPVLRLKKNRDQTLKADR